MKWINTKAFDQLDPSIDPTEDVSDLHIGRFGAHDGKVYTEGYKTREDIPALAADLPYTFRVYTVVGYLAYEGKSDDCTSADALLPLKWFEKETILAGYICYLQDDGTWKKLD